jgi:hypothetical protein
VIFSLLGCATTSILLKAWVWHLALHDDAYVERFYALKKR